MKKVILTLAAFFTMATMSYAIPSLQLDIAGGTYVGGTDETTYAPGSLFTLYALADTKNFAGGNYYLSVALVPKTETGGSYGSFTIDGATVNVTADMAYGVPPYEANLAHDGGDLGQHSIFETFFKEYQFTFDSDQIKTYNTQETTMPLSGPVAGTGLYYQPFVFDVAGLSADYGLHFDLYSVNFLNGDIDKNEFAPFSHDAQSVPPVPEPGTMMLLGVGMLGLVIFGKRRMYKNA